MASTESILTPNERLSIDIYLAVTNASEATYDAVRSALQRDKRCKRICVLSYHSVKALVRRVSGVTAVYRDMCVKSCVAFTGPFVDLEHCPTCGLARYGPGNAKVPQKQFSTILLGPQLQALEYRRLCTERKTTAYSDFFHGDDYLEAVEQERIKEEDMLYRNKQSDCWIRYKKRYPGNLDSFLFPALWHLSALQRDGLRIWDASRDACFRSLPYLALVTADGPGMAAMNGFVGHHGKCHCRLYCPLPGRHKAGASHYYPARCSHPDEAAQRYKANLAYLSSSSTKREYEARRLHTGIVKPSIFSGLPPAHVSRLPALFAGDYLLIPLWRGTFDCDKTDNRDDWPWATLRVVAAHPWIPGSHDRLPRNPAEKISSGYKAWEFLIWFYDLPREYWRHYCKLEEILPSEAHEAHRLLTEWSTEFEELYVQRRADRLHFVLGRIGPGIIYSQWTMERTIGNLGEEIKQHANAFANLMQRGLRRCQVNALKAIIPDLAEPIDNPLPYGAFKVDEGYALLRAKDRAARVDITELEIQAMHKYLRAQGYSVRDDWCPPVVRWARLRLPNGQTARCRWKEEVEGEGDIRASRHVKITLEGVERIAEVHYFMKLGPELELDEDLEVSTSREKAVAVVSMFGFPHAGLLDESSRTYYTCEHLRDIDIKSVVMMAPDPSYGKFHQDGTENNRWYLMEKPGLKLLYFIDPHAASAS
ncbi:hypothetical protein EV121DRAFT_284020 [Schizophyllum commune]